VNIIAASRTTQMGRKAKQQTNLWLEDKTQPNHVRIPRSTVTATPSESNG